jgi:hypothetical protein
MMDVVERVAKFFPNLTEDDKRRVNPSGKGLTFRNRVQWSRLDLVHRGDLDKSVRGLWGITAQGRKRLEAEWDEWNPAPQGTGSKGNAKRAAEQSLRKGLVTEEKELYNPLLTWLRNNWGKEAEQDGDAYWVNVTALMSRRGQAGRWSRPDIVSVQVNRLDILPHRLAEVTSFEVKRYDDARDVKSVYEAAAHQRWAHYSYLVAEASSDNLSLPDPVLSEAARFGVGVLTLQRDSQGEAKVEAVLSPKRQEPAPRDLDGALKDFFADDDKELRRLKDSLR